MPEVDIEIFAQTPSQHETLKIKISDNGEGFTDERYKNFQNYLM